MMIYNAHIVTCEDAVFESGYICFQGTKITAVGDMADAPAPAAGDYDAEGGWVLPGYIDPHCHVGCGPEATGSAEYSEVTKPIVPQYDGIDAFYPLDAAIPKCLKRGITTVVSGPGSTTLIGGQLAAFKLNGGFAREACIKRACAIKFAMGEAPKSVFGGKGLGTRMALAARLRDTFAAVDDYIKNKEAGRLTKTDRAMEALVPLLKGEIFAHVHAMRADDINTFLDIAEEYGIKTVIVHGQQTVRLCERMREMGAGVIHGPLMFTSRDLESDGISFSSPMITQQAGVLSAVCTDACPGLGSAQMLPVNASLIARAGMDPIDAIKLITVNAAKLAGIEDRVGSLKAGKDADIVVYDDMPLEYTAHTKAVFVDGRRMTV